MLIINADDWGRSKRETDAALSCYSAGRVTSATAMVFMEDSERGAELGKEIGVDLGLHLNLSEPFVSGNCTSALKVRHERISRFLNFSRYASLLYNPVIRQDFRYVYQAQMDEFVRLFGRPPSHVDGHQHQHLCTNMLLDFVIPAGAKVRPTFYFWPGEKGPFNRTYRHFVNRLLARRHTRPDYFFALSQCLEGDRFDRVVRLSESASVEVMTHPANPREYAFLMGKQFHERLERLQRGTYALL